MILRKIGDWPTWDWRSPFDELERMRRDMDRLFEGIAGGILKGTGAGVFPLMNVTEDKENYYVRAELPGMKGDELEISITGNNLSISGERKIPSEEENAKYHRREREPGRFNRVLTLPGDLDASKVDARATDGVLTIILPKAEAAKPKQIAVKAS